MRAAEVECFMNALYVLAGAITLLLLIYLFLALLKAEWFG